MTSMWKPESYTHGLPASVSPCSLLHVIQDCIIILDETVVLSPGEYAQEFSFIYLFVYAKNDQNFVLISAFVNLYDINYLI